MSFPSHFKNYSDFIKYISNLKHAIVYNPENPESLVTYVMCGQNITKPGLTMYHSFYKKNNRIQLKKITESNSKKQNPTQKNRIQLKKTESNSDAAIMNHINFVFSDNNSLYTFCKNTLLNHYMILFRMNLECFDFIYNIKVYGNSCTFW
jgi:hypothetical protein